jgi:hypothetical protein
MSDQKINESFDSILEQEAKDVAVISERVFKATILPMIANQDDDQADFSGWLTIAGTWRRPIDVTDDKTNEVLFRVPALVGDNDLPSEQQGTNSAYEVIQNARRKMQTVPRAGEEHLIRGLRPRIKVKGEMTENQKRWNYIYQRYGLDFQAGGDASSDTGSGGDGKAPGPDVVGYDEI